jgi:beta-glucosidase
MAKALRVFSYILLSVLTLILILFIWFYLSRAIPIWQAKSNTGPPADTLYVDGKTFRDLNKNGILDPYEDLRLPVEIRVEDLLSQMTLEEKAGLMYHTFIFPGKDGRIAGALNPMNLLPVESALFNKHMHFFNLYMIPEGKLAAAWLNKIQELAERTRLGIPVTISSDPRHTAMSEGAAVAVHTPAFSHWTEPIGLAAIGDTALVKRFGEIAAKEYRAIGIHTALHPMVDLATEPRWGRISGTFGEDARLSADLGAAYIRGFQGDSLSSASVSVMSKHFPGGGPQKDGWDAHFEYGKDQIYPGNNFDYHLIPFAAAIEAGTAQMMPYYGVPVGQTSEDVAFGFNREILTELLRDEMGFEGIVCTDWNIINPLKIFGFELMQPRAFGVEHLSPPERTAKAIEAGVDQFGGESSPEQIVQLVNNGLLSETRIDESVRRLLTLKFLLGLFENPFVDIDRVEEQLATDEAVQLGYESQLRSQVLLTNQTIDGKPLLPLENGSLKLYVDGHNPSVAALFGDIVDDPDEADVIILNINPPFDPGYGRLAGIQIFREGRLYYTDDELEPVLALLNKKPVVVTTYLERPSMLTEIAEKAGAILANFGATELAMFDIIFGNFNPEGKLPFDLPSDWDSVLNQQEDVPFDLENPLFRFGHGLSYDRYE